ncbi:ricin-type beta-trefoil lectin domain protein [Solihabitans fulvus]|uniref:Ricin-type beta-trefoil lectin domain protein n=2 Tax=Solihabitans fulvus TaxID=1892852 RepID=A0A5B2XEF5_9PSEU|nr:ricin-type beta-trefoil lectin domain protein [Solihabitans fulvus]
MATACIALLSVMAMLTGIGTASAAAPKSSTQQAFITLYGWWDNTPPGGAISYPGLHQSAGGTGTYADPITFATATAEVKSGGRIYVPRVGKYFIMEDGCEECDADWNGKGPNGGPNLWHFDLWEGGKGGNPITAIECENALTHYNPDTTPILESVVVNPPANEPVTTEPIYNTKTGACYGGAKPTITVGPYKNNATGQCLDDPGDRTTPGWTAKMAACNGSAEQRFTFDGTFLSVHSAANQSGAICADAKSGPIMFKTCTGGPTQQWSANPNLTISDIQTGKKCFRASGTSVTAGSCSGAAAKWTVPTS